MIIRRSLFAFVLSTVIAAGTWFTVTKNTNDAEQTVRDINKSSLEYQKQTQKAIEDVNKGTRSIEEVSEETTKAGKKLASDSIDAVQANDSVPDEVKAQLEEAQKEFGVE